MVMVDRLSARLRAVVDALPLKAGMRVIEIGCGPGAAAREVAERVGPRGHVLAVDRSVKAIATVERRAADLISAGRMTTVCCPAEAVALPEGHAPYDLCFAVRVGAFDGRHPKVGQVALPRVAAMLRPGGRMFIDGGNPLREVRLRAPDDGSTLR